MSSESNYDVCKSKKVDNFNGIKCMFANSQQILRQLTSNFMLIFSLFIFCLNFSRAPKHVVPTTILPKSHFDIITVNKPENKKQVTDEGTFDFVDSPLGDKQLLSSGSSQASRVNVKKGPNGQDYEYEYVYYYYDEDDEPVGLAKPAGPATARAPLTTEASRGRRPVTESQEQDIAPQKANSRNR